MSVDYFLQKKMSADIRPNDLFELGHSEYVISEALLMYFDTNSVHTDILLEFESGKKIFFSKLRDSEFKQRFEDEYHFDELDEFPELLTVTRVIYSKINKKAISAVAKLYYYLDPIFYVFNKNSALSIRKSIRRLQNGVKSRQFIVAYDYSESMDTSVQDYMSRGNTLRHVFNYASFGDNLVSQLGHNFKGLVKADVSDIANTDISKLQLNRIASDTNMKKILRDIKKGYDEDELLDRYIANGIVSNYAYFSFFDNTHTVPDTGTNFGSIVYGGGDLTTVSPGQDLLNENAGVLATIARNQIVDALALISEAS